MFIHELKPSVRKHSNRTEIRARDNIEIHANSFNQIKIIAGKFTIYTKGGKIHALQKSLFIHSRVYT